MMVYVEIFAILGDSFMDPIIYIIYKINRAHINILTENVLKLMPKKK